MLSLKKMLSLLTLLLITFGGQLQAQEADVLEEQGIIEELKLAGNELIISGVTFKVAFDAEVQIRGSYGAYSMLQPGMKVYYEYRRYSPTELEIFTIEQLPDNQPIEES